MSLLNPSEECVAGVLKEYGTTMIRLKEDVQVIKEWLNQQPHLPHTFDENTLQHFLIRCKNSVERTKQTIDMHYTVKTAVPEFFAGRDPLQQQLQFVIENTLIVPLPQITHDGYRVTIMKTLLKDSRLFSTEMFFKVVFMVADLRIIEDSAIGDIIIYDTEFLGMGHISKISLPTLKKIEICSSKGYSARLKGIHFINAPPAIDILFTAIKKVLRHKLARRHHVHTNIETLYEHLDRDILPVEYGGKEKSIAEIAVEWQQKLTDKRDWFIDQEQNGKAIEAKRPGKRFCTSELFGFEGTFKQLAVD